LESNLSVSSSAFSAFTLPLVGSESRKKELKKLKRALLREKELTNAQSATITKMADLLEDADLYINHQEEEDEQEADSNEGFHTCRRQGS
jgi:hypothetical protein